MKNAFRYPLFFALSLLFLSACNRHASGMQPVKMAADAPAVVVVYQTGLEFELYKSGMLIVTPVQMSDCMEPPVFSGFGIVETKAPGVYLFKCKDSTFEIDANNAVVVTNWERY